MVPRRSTPPLVRVVIPAHRSGEDLLWCIEAVLASDLPVQPEIVVIDNGGNDDLAARLSHLPVTVIYDEARHSAAYARTRGAHGFRQGILVFLDDDVICEPSAISRLILPIMLDECDATVGNYSADVRGLGFAQAYKQLYVHHIYARRSGELPNEYWTAIGAIRADVFHAMGGFNHNFQGACGEDMDLGIRLTQAGYKIMAVPEAMAKHLHAFTIGGLIKNDHRKGMIAMYNTSTRHIPLSQHRHSSYRDIFAVGFALCTIACALSIVVLGSKLVALACICLLGWGLCRSRLLQLFLREQGAIFTVRASLLMITLDLVRAYCVVSGSIRWKIGWKSSSIIASHEPLQGESGK